MIVAVIFSIHLPLPLDDSLVSRLSSGHKDRTPAQTITTAKAPNASGVSGIRACGPSASGIITGTTTLATSPRSSETDFKAGQRRSITVGCLIKSSACAFASSISLDDTLVDLPWPMG